MAEITPNLLVSITGDPKTGKTHLSMTFPEPMVIYSFDRGAELPRKRFAQRNITIRSLLPPVNPSTKPIEDEKKLLEVFDETYKDDLASGQFETFVIDPASILWELIWHTQQYAEGDEKLIARKYGEPNARMKSYLDRAAIAGVNLVLIHYLKEIYVGEKPTGEFKMDGFRRTEGLVDLVLMTRKVTKTVPKKAKEDIGLETQIITTIKDSRYGLDLHGYELINATYDDLMALVLE